MQGEYKLTVMKLSEQIYSVPDGGSTLLFIVIVLIIFFLLRKK